MNEKDELILESILEQQVAEQAFQKGEMTGLGTEKHLRIALAPTFPFPIKIEFMVFWGFYSPKTVMSKMTLYSSPTS